MRHCGTKPRLKDKPMTPGPTTCAVCAQHPVFTNCTGCGTGICESCAHFELIGSGCGCVWPAYYCSRCVADPLINPNAPLR
jgi:hypothetical protein